MQKKYGLRLAILLSAANVTISALAQTPEESAQTNTSTIVDDEDEAKEIVVTGTSIRGIAPVAVPLLTFDREDILGSGAPSLAEFLRTVPQNTGGGSASDEGRALGAFFGGSAVSFRGFGPDRALTLLNGHRVAPQGDGTFVDINFIPVAAIERVEIVPVGASSIYGADAVGGVINFTLRDDYEGLESRALIGTTTHGDGNTINLSQSGGVRWETGSALIAYDYFEQDRIQAGQRDFTDPDLSRTSLVPAINRHSIIGAIRQNLSENVELLIDSYLVSSDTRRTSQFPFVADVLGSNVPLEENIETLAYGTTATLRADIGPWQAQLIGTFSRNDLDGFDIDTRTGEPTNIFANIEFSRDNRIALIEPRFDGPLFALPGGSARLAVGGQLRYERFVRVLGPDSPASDNRRSVASGYGEIYLPFIGPDNGIAGIHKLELNISGRYERFGNVDESLSTGEDIARGGKADSIDPQVSLLYAPVPSLDLRATYGTSFTVAPLTTLRRDNRIFASRFLTVDALPDDASNTLFLSGVDPDLGPETSTYWTVGADWRPTFAPGLTLSATYYNIDLRNVLGSPSGSRDPSNPLIADFVILNPNEEQIRAAIASFGLTPADIFTFGAAADDFNNRGFASIGAIYNASTTNLTERVYEGIDFGLDYRRDLGTGQIGAEANVVLITRYKERSSDAQPLVDRLDTPFQPLNLNARMGLFWSNDKLRANIFANYADDYVDNRFDVDRKVDDFLTFDLNLAVAVEGKVGGEGTQFSLSVQNLFDQDPPRLVGLSNENDSFTGDIGYDFVNASARGRFISISVRRTW
ncbi:TonB-dependent receptor plug domain-containing protein [Parasphingorhabdus cellanae]|uniref:TonB-dependent receptor n=1 Tax=Parasphingorhabdus cellanae TaxID=2806553 RepID=A0ABX7T6F4_9SPHN|nr:TonB-dependent receptor [Parasphingorhabdus cellanae]QTD57175.1 TonB-dependent receptor [Parasphingorhabdus cellanae]